MAENFKCAICLDIFEAPVELTCGHMFCSSCIKLCFGSSNTSECPECRQRVNYQHVKSPNKKLMSLLHSFNIQCDYANVGCRIVVTLDNLVDHSRKCNFNISCTPSAPSEESNNENPQLVAALLDDIFNVVTQQISNRNETLNEPQREAHNENRSEHNASNANSTSIPRRFYENSISCCTCVYGLFESCVGFLTSCIGSLWELITENDDARLFCKLIAVLLFACLLMIPMLFFH